MDKKRDPAEVSQPIHRGKVKLQDVTKEDGPGARTLVEADKLERRLKYQNQLPSRRTALEPPSSRSSYLDIARRRQREQTLDVERTLKMADDIVDEMKAMRSKMSSASISGVQAGSKILKPRSSLTVPKRSLQGSLARDTPARRPAARQSRKKSTNVDEHLGAHLQTATGEVDMDLLIAELRSDQGGNFYYLRPTSKVLPFRYKIVPFDLVDKSNVCTISANGFTCNRTVFTESYFVPFGEWVAEYEITKQLWELKTFGTFQISKFFYKWRNTLRWKRFQKAQSLVAREAFILDEIMQVALQQIYGTLQDILQLCFYETTLRSASSTAEFDKPQERLELDVYKKYQETCLSNTWKAILRCRTDIHNVILDMFERMLARAGFTMDDSDPLDIAVSTQPVSSVTSMGPTVRRSNVFNRPETPENFRFSRVLKKKEICDRISRFILRVDYVMQTTLKELLVKSMRTFLDIVDRNLKYLPSQQVLEGDEIDRILEDERPDEPQSPLLLISISTSLSDFVFRPLQHDFISAKDEIIAKWFSLTLNMDTFMQSRALTPVLQPILRGERCHYRLGGQGPSFKKLLAEKYEGLLEPWPYVSNAKTVVPSQPPQPVRTLLERLQDELDEKFERNTQALDIYVRRFEDIRTSFKDNAFEDKNTFQGEKSIEEYRELLQKYETQVSNLNKLVESQPLGLYLLQMQNLTQILMPKAELLLDKLKQILPEVGKDRISRLSEKLIAAQSYLDQDPEETCHLIEYLEFLDTLEAQVGLVDRELEYCDALYALIDEFEIKYPFEDKTSHMVVTDLLHNLHSKMDSLLADKDKLVGETFQEKIQRDIENLMDRIEDINIKAEDPTLLSLELPTSEALEKLDILLAELNDCQENANSYKIYQKKFGVEVSEYPILNKLIPDVHNRRRLRTSYTEWMDKVLSWSNGRFENLDPDEMTTQVKIYGALVASLEKTLPPNQIVAKLKQSVEKMRDKLSVITALRNPALEPRHMEMIEALVGEKIDLGSLTLVDLEDLGVFDHEEDINEISGRASAESGLKSLLEKIENTWKNLEFICLPHRGFKNAYILSGLEEIQVTLDESLMSLATILSSRQVGQIKESAEQWRNKLFLFSKTMDEWTSFQNSWIYLESIFSGPDIQKQLPTEGKLFAEVNKFWKDIMTRTAVTPQAFATVTSPEFLPAFVANNQIMDSILKNLEAYLDVKRASFPRFYFLSNEELLEILGQARNPQAVQPHLGKCFDGITALEFGTKKLKPLDPNDPDEEPRTVPTADILAMVSPEREVVRLGKGLTARGSVEDWLAKVERSMFMTLRRLMKAALLDFSTRSRTTWVLRHAAQIVLTISQVMWCADITEILNPQHEDAVIDANFQAFEQKCFRELNDMAGMVRGELTALQRATLCALITIDVHARDIVSSMVRNQVRDPDAFEWLKQLRYYWDEEIDNCVGKMAFASFVYGYEYLGASPRLVITPLTDKCYLCLMGALQLNLGGAPAGPAGTGKTETTKDLAKSLAIQCVVFNCSDTLDYKIMGRLLGGMAQSGAWICFDEFNRIDIEVLSVVAQQLVSITNAKMAGVSSFLFEGKMIRLVSSCAAFITMNPGYAGRTELPDNLKTLFRPMAMMVPDYGLIAEVVLYSEGFESSKHLARKMVNMYKLCSEQLSQQDHYDFGMRAVKSVLVMAGSLKRANPDRNEDVVLIRALRDSNLPKFLADDAALFLGILNDLFPGIELPVEDYGSFQSAMESVMMEHNLQLEPGSFLKTIQLYETMLVRHGVMTVGPTGGGKTAVLNILKWTLTRLYETGVPGAFFRPVHTYTLNPKSVSSGELYGEANPVTMEWRDGLIGIFTRTAVQSPKEDHQWVICDGPIDAVWIENMNSVLDDNKLLCLANSERIKLTKWVHMMFEVQDLSQASPATVSRCGMVYIDSTTLGWKPYVKTWLHGLFDKVSLIKEEFHDTILGLFEQYMNPGLQFVAKHCTAAIHQVDVSKGRMICSLIESCLLEPGMLDRSHPSQNTASLLVRIFVWAYMWSIGGNLMDESQDRFEAFARDQFADNPHLSAIKDSDLRSYFVSKDTQQLTPWSAITPVFTYDPAMSFFDMMVPTIDTVRYGALMEKLLLVNHPVMFTGVTGVGKTAIARSTLSKLMGTDRWAALTINFSAQTSSARAQDILEGKLDKRTKTLMGAPLGKRLAVFVDDVNMPKLETYGAQPPIELLRQFLDFGGLYDREKMFWKTIQDVVLCAGCAPPGGGRNPLTPRFVRHFGLLAIPSPSEDALKVIFKSILSGFLSIFPAAVQSVADSIINAAVEVYNRIAEDLLPTPAKSHYVFNLRDLSKCVQGILQASVDFVKTSDDIFRLYYHESLRVFHDRLINQEDKAYFYRLLKQVCSSHLGTPVLEFSDVSVASDPPVLLFGDFMSGGAKEDRAYQEIRNVEKLKQVLDDFLSNFNLVYSRDMSLLFFMDAVCHVTRIARILRSERGNALLVGLSGMGKQSLTILASHMNGYRCHQIELTRTYDYSAFHEDLRRFYILAGAQNQDTVFLLTDTQILQEEFLEDVNNILNSGEVPNLFEAEEFENVQTLCRTAAKEAGLNESDRDAVYEFFISRVRNKLHVVLSMSPVGDNFRRRCRMFPSLVNCCTIDWFVDWPREALESVATNSLKSLENDELVKKLSPMCYTIHESVEKMTHRYFNEVRKHYYVTPSSYLEMLRQYLGLLDVNVDKVKSLKDRIENGLNKIAETNVLVATMQDKLTRMEPELKAKSEDTAALMVSLEKEKAAASQEQQVVAADEAIAKVKAIETQAIADDAQKDLALALPALEAATAALESLNKGDIGEMKGFLNPPELVQYVMEAVLILLGYKQLDWTTAKVALGESDFLRKLQQYDKDNVAESTLNKLKPYIESVKFDPERVAGQSKVAKSLCVWVRAIDMYCKVAKDVEPKRRSLETAEKELEQIMSVLRAKQQRLAEVEAKIAKLEATFDASMAEKAELENSMVLGKARLERAGRLTNALGDEEVRWKELVKSFATELNNMVGDVLIGSAYVAYLGAFTSTYRTELCMFWLQRLDELKIPASPSFSLVKVLADPFEIRTWNSFGLPRDSVSTDNAIICTRSRKWPLMIDPQEQASRWIRNMEAPNGIKILKLTDSTYMRTMEACIRLGLPVLLEDVGENLDPALAPILLKQTVTKGGRTLIKLGDTLIDYDPRFRLYLTSKLPSPHYLPETCIQICLMDFTVTAKGLEDQLMADVVRLERPDLERERLQVIATMNKNKAILKEIEDNILRLLFTSEGNILDNEELINTLNESKETSTAIAQRLIVAEETDAAISVARDKYRSVAERGSCLYFVVAVLADIDPMYQFSLKYFNALFVSVIEKSERATDVERRIQILEDSITLAAYNNVSRGLFERHKLVYSFLLCVAIQRQAKSLPESYWSFLLRGPLGSTKTPPPKPNVQKLTDSMWTTANYLASAYPDKFRSLPSVCTQRIQLSVGAFELVIHLDESLRPSEVNYDESLSAFEKLMLIKCLKEEKLVFGVTEYVAVSLGKVFCESPSVNLHDMFKDMSKTTPLVFVLSPGSDPFGNFQRFAGEMGYTGNRVHAISLGQGQGRIAEVHIEKAARVGDWVFLQNCHVASSWLVTLEKLVLGLVEETDDEVHRDFRLFMSSMPAPKFPVSVLQNSVKVTNEPPKGIRSNVKRSLAGGLDEQLFNSHSLEASWRKMVFGMCFFHAVIQERKKFGPLGWSILYEFNDSDLECALGTLKMYCARDTIPWEALTYTFGEVNYGGRVTDVWDQRTLRTILLSYFGPHTLKPGYVYSASGTYYCPESPKCNTLDGYRAFIEELPIIEEPEIFGMHDNANIAFQMKETHQVMKTILDVQPREGGSSEGQSPDEMVLELCDVVMQRIKTKIDKDTAHPTLLQKDEKGRLPSLTTVLMQETDRFNKVLANIHTSLGSLKKAIMGFIVMNDELEEVYNSFLNNQVPKMWSAKCYPSMKSLGSWIKDLVLRIDFISVWLSHGPPVSFWLPGFFFPQGFMTGCQQTHARRRDLAIDTLKIDFEMTGVVLQQEEIEMAHRNAGGAEVPSCYKTLTTSPNSYLVHGLFLDAANYDVTVGSLCDPEPGIIHPPLPAMALCPVPVGSETDSKRRYACPLYKTAGRAGTLSTTGHSTNFVVQVMLPSRQPEEYWVLKGAALLTQITD